MCCVRCRARVVVWKGSGLGGRMKLIVETRCDCSTLVSEGGACWSYSPRLTLAGGWAQARPNCKHTEDWLKTLYQTNYSLCMLDTGASPTRPPPLAPHACTAFTATHKHTHTPAHGGNRAKVCDFDWNPASRWCFASVSDDSADSGLGGGTLQLWRMWPAIAGLDDDVAAQVKHRMELLAGAS